MDKQTIINRLADICYRPKTEDDDDFAVQIFIETLAVPKGVLNYTRENMKKYLENFTKDLEFGDEIVE